MRVQRALDTCQFGAAAETGDIFARVLERQRQQNRRRVHAAIQAFRADDSESQHRLVKTSVPRIDFDQQMVDATNQMGIDVGHIEQGHQHRLGLRHRIHGQLGELANLVAGAAQLIHFIAKKIVGQQPVVGIKAHRQSAYRRAVIIGYQRQQIGTMIFRQARPRIAARGIHSLDQYAG